MFKFFGRLLRRGRERMSAFLAMISVLFGIVWLSYSLVRYGHTDNWNVGFIGLLGATVANYIAGKVTAKNEAQTKEEKDEAVG